MAQYEKACMDCKLTGIDPEADVCPRCLKNNVKKYLLNRGKATFLTTNQNKTI